MKLWPFRFSKEKRSPIARSPGSWASARAPFGITCAGKLKNASDGRKKTGLIVQLGLEAVVAQWWATQVETLPEGRSPNIRLLWQFLVEEHGHSGSYKSVRKYVPAQFPAPKLRPFRRVETPPGAQMQSDWLEVKIDLGEEDRVPLYGFLMTLSHSRMTAVLWSRSMTQLAWQTYCEKVI